MWRCAARSATPRAHGVRLGAIRQRTDAAVVSSTAGSAGFSLPIGSHLSLFSEASWNSEIAGLSAVSISNTALNASVNWDLPQGFLLSATGRYSRDSSVVDGAPFDPRQAPALGEFLFDRISDSYQFTLRLQKRFGWGRSVQRTVGGALAGRPLEFGSISGVVFNDLDLDGVRGLTEPSVPEVAVRLDDEVLAAVGPDGSFEFGSVAVGPHTVELELVTVPASYDLGPRPRLQVDVTKGETVVVPFPLLQLGKIRGAIVVADRTVEDVRDTAAPERAGANLAVRLTDSEGTTRTTISDEDGEFEFTSLPTSEYQLLVDDTSLPDHWTVLAENALTVTMTPGGRAENLQLAVAANPRAVRRINLNRGPETSDEPLSPTLEREFDERGPTAIRLERAVNTSRGGPEPSLPPALIAVGLGPFVNARGGTDDGWIGQFVKDAMLVEVVHMPGTQIIDLGTRAWGLGEDRQDLRTLLAMCRERGATMLITGDYQRIGDQLRVAVQLVDVRTGAPLREMGVDGDLDDLVPLQDRLALVAAESLSN